jgi:HK97 family phage major capsid protein
MVESVIEKIPFDDVRYVGLEDLIQHRTLTIEGLRSLVMKCKSGDGQFERDFSPQEEEIYQSCNEYIEQLSAEIEIKKNTKTPHIAGRKAGGSIMENIFKERRGLTYRDLFYEGRSEVTFERGGYKDFNEFLTVVTKKLETRTMSEGSGTDGGFTVPEYWAAEIWDSALEQSVFLDGTSMYPMKSNVLYVPAWKSDDHSSGPIGGIEGQWLGELQTGTRKTPKLRFIKFDANKLALFVQASIELEDDSLTLKDQIAPTLRRSLNFSLDDALISGNGVAKPTGLILSGSTVSHSRSAANSIGFADVCGMYARLHPSLVVGARWIASPASIPQLLQVTTTAGEALFIPKGGLSEKVPGFILGCPLYISEKASNLGTKADLIFCNPLAYGLGLRKEMTFERSISPGWTEYAADYRLVCRVAGQALMDTAITPKNGGATLSWAVVLE